ncbi:MAG: hypothetical protein ACI4L7_01435 [Christensenellales bacterium]
MDNNQNDIITIDGVDFVKNDTKGNAKKLAEYIFQNEKEIAMTYSKKVADELYTVRYEFEKKFKSLPLEYDASEIVLGAIDVTEKKESFWERKASKYFNVYKENWFARAKYLGQLMDLDIKALTSALSYEAYRRAKEDLIALTMDVYKRVNYESVGDRLIEKTYEQLMNYYRETIDDNIIYEDNKKGNIDAYEYMDSEVENNSNEDLYIDLMDCNKSSEDDNKEDENNEEQSM